MAHNAASKHAGGPRKTVALYSCEKCFDVFCSKDDLALHKESQCDAGQVTPGNGEDVDTNMLAKVTENPSGKQKTGASHKTLFVRAEAHGVDASAVSSSVAHASSTVVTSPDAGSKEAETALSSLDIARLAQFSDEEILAKLTENQHIFVCRCGSIYRDRTLYYLHRGCHNTNDEQKCGFCGYQARDWTQFLTHFFVHKKKYPS